MPKRILVIDDDPHTVKYLVTLFQDHGYGTLSAADGKEGAEILKEEIPDLITLDLDMSKEWGPKFYRRLMKDDRLKDIPVIVISGMPRAELAIKKAMATFRKPFDRDELMATIREVIGE